MSTRLMLESDSNSTQESIKSDDLSDWTLNQMLNQRLY